MRLAIRHTTRYRYVPEAQGVSLRLRLFPAALESQKIGEWRVEVNEHPVSPLLTDGFGEREGLWHHHGRIAEIDIVAEGLIDTADTAGVVRGLPPRSPAGVYLRPTALTAPSPGVSALAQSVEGTETDPLARMHALNDAIHDTIAYRQGVSTSATTADETLARGTGVCQDQAHLFIASARALGIPARYVVGYLLPFDPADEDDPERADKTPAASAPSEIAVDETHAWVETYIDRLGWTGFDPTHKLCPTDRYVRLTAGLDAADAAPIRGHVVGAAEEALAASVEVTAAPKAMSQGQQQ